jgi:BirA family biotin operon repressor/biotin-[acetyl-CoA-carboxylase] ligase
LPSYKRIGNSATGFGAPHRHFSLTESTNTRARELAAAGAPHGTIVTAGEQTAGRGRQGRTWTAPPNTSLLYSAILRPLQEHHVMLPLAVPLAVCAAAEALEPNAECGVKWPNDVHLQDRKLAGVLIEARPQDGWAVIGIGLNLTITPDQFPPDLQDKAISLFAGPAAVSPSGSDEGDLGKARGSLPAVAPEGLPQIPLTATKVLNTHLAHWIEADPAQVLEEWKKRDVLKGREISWADGSGVADGVDDRGYLVVITPGGDRIALGAGEVHLRL